MSFCTTCLLVLLVLARQSAAQDTVRAQPDSVLPDTASIMLVYNEQSASDSTRAAVARLVVRLAPDSSWGADTVPAGESKEETVLRIFRYSRTLFPQTTQLLISVLDSVNGPGRENSWGAGVIRTPPLPIRGHSRYGFEAAFRAYDVTRRQYAFFKAARVTKEATYYLARTDSAPPAGAMQDSAITNGTTTTISLPVAEGDVDDARELLAGVTDEVALWAAGGLVRLDLYGRTRAECTDGSDWLTGSPYRARTLARIAAMSTAERARLLTDARSVPLTILDWKVAAASKGHGSKVRSVVAQLLDSLGLGFLGPQVRAVDLDPQGADTTWLLGAMDELQLYYVRKRQWGAARSAQFTAAREWIRTAAPSDFAQTHLAVLQAALWRSIGKGAGVTNLSFGVTHPVLSIAPPDLPRNGDGFGVLAAGNTRGALQLSTAIQNVAWDHPSLVNVTSAALDGVVFGTYSDTGIKANVSIAAPGCGFSGGTLTPADSGSSLASPFVATAAWVSRLIDPALRGSLRDRMTMSTSPAPHLSAPVQSEGLFDPWLLLAWPDVGPHVLRPDGRIARLGAMRLDIEVGDTPYRLTYRASPVVPRRLVIGLSDAQDTAWLRLDPAGASVIGPLVSAKGSLTLDGQVVPIADVPALRAVVSAILY